MVPAPASDASAPPDPQLPAANRHLAPDELDAKSRTLHNRAHATATDPANTYAVHAATLEAKRARLAAQLTRAGTPPAGPAPGSSCGTTSKTWATTHRPCGSKCFTNKEVVRVGLTHF